MWRSCRVNSVFLSNTVPIHQSITQYQYNITRYIPHRPRRHAVSVNTNLWYFFVLTYISAAFNCTRPVCFFSPISTQSYCFFLPDTDTLQLPMRVVIYVYRVLHEITTTRILSIDNETVGRDLPFNVPPTNRNGNETIGNHTTVFDVNDWISAIGLVGLTALWVRPRKSSKKVKYVSRQNLFQYGFK